MGYICLKYKHNFICSDSLKDIKVASILYPSYFLFPETDSANRLFECYAPLNFTRTVTKFTCQFLNAFEISNKIFDKLRPVHKRI